MAPILEKFVVLVLSWVIFTSSNLKISHEMALIDVMSYNELTMLPVPNICSTKSHVIPDPFIANLISNSLIQDQRLKNKSDAVFCSEKSVEAWGERTGYYLRGNTSFRSLSFSDCAVQKIYSDFIKIPYSNFSFNGKRKSWYLHLLDFTKGRESTIDLDPVQLADTFTKYVYPVNMVSFSGTQMERSFSSHSSIQAISLPTMNLYIASSIANNSIATIQYEEKMIQIKVTVGKEVVMTVPFRTKDFMNHYPYFGFQASKKMLDGVYQWEENMQSQNNKTNLQHNLIIAVCALSFSLFLTCTAGAGYFLFKRNVKRRRYISRALRRLSGSPRKFNFHDLNKATDNFDEKQKLGQGGLGAVYKGYLHRENKQVAVKKITFPKSIKHKDGFLAELRVISCLRHKHLVEFQGWCYKRGMLLFVYEYIPYGSLDKHLFGGSSILLSWGDRYKILLGVASALQYLHSGTSKKVVHRGVKSSNIMLDFDLNARLGDFEVTRALDNEKTKTIHVELEGLSSTFVYTAPECLLTGKATEDSDIYGFGIVLLEVTCGRRAWGNIGGFSCLVNWVRFLYDKGRILEAIDKRLANNIDVKEAERVLILALTCSHPTAAVRPKSKNVLQILSGCMPTPDISPFEPALPSLQLCLQKTKQ